MAKRLNIYINCLYSGNDKWNRVIFSDETKIEPNNPSNGNKIWKLKSQYNGLQSEIADVADQHFHIRRYAHVLNLVE